MKRIICGILLALLLVAAIGCGGGSPAPVGKTMTNNEINQLFSDMSTAQTAIYTTTDYVTTLTSTGSSTISSKGLKIKTVPTYTWTEASLGWYETTQTESGVSFTLRIRFIEATNTIEFSQSFQMTVFDVTMTTTDSFSLSKNNDLWSGNYTNTLALSTGEATKIEFSFSNVDENNGCGTFDMWMTVTGGSNPMSRTQCAHFTVSYDSTNSSTPIHFTGWYGFGSSTITLDDWVAISTP
jgi:hypothetical protein